MYGSVANAGDPVTALKSLVEASGFAAVNVNETQCSFGAVTVNNLPILCQVTYDSFQDQFSVLYKFAVPPLRDLTTECIKFVLTRAGASNQTASLF